MPHRALIYYTWLVEPRELAPTTISTSLNNSAVGQASGTQAYYRDLTAVRIGADGVTIDDTIPRCAPLLEADDIRRDYAAPDPTNQLATSTAAAPAKREVVEEPTVEDDTDITVEASRPSMGRLLVYRWMRRRRWWTRARRARRR